MIREAVIGLQSSKRSISLIIIIATLVNSGVTISQAWQPETYPDYYQLIIPSVQKCNPLQYPITESISLGPNDTVLDYGQTHHARDPLKWWINCISYKEFHSPSLLPILFNLSLMPLVYLLALELTKNKLIGLISFIAFIANPLYNQWITSGTYDQIWAFFLILSVYLMYRFKRVGTIASGISFVTGLTAKALGLMYLPSLLYSYYKTDRPTSDKVMVTILTVGIISVLGILFYNKLDLFGGAIGFHPENISLALSRDFEMLLPELPFLGIFGLLAFYFRPKQTISANKTCAVWIVNALITTPVIFLFTNQFQFVYRFVPLAVFMSIMIGITIIQISQFFIEVKLKSKTDVKK